jgi:hypothetical protein
MSGGSAVFILIIFLYLRKQHAFHSPSIIRTPNRGGSDVLCKHPTRFLLTSLRTEGDCES